MKQYEEARLAANGGKWGRGPTIAWISMPPLCGLARAGLPTRVPVVSWDKIHGVFKEEQRLAKDVFGDDLSNIELHDDPDWKIFPDLGDVLLMNGVDETCITVATINYGGSLKWAVGMAGGLKNRQATTRIALAVAIAPELKTYGRILSDYPCFAELCFGAVQQQQQALAATSFLEAQAEQLAEPEVKAISPLGNIGVWDEDRRSFATTDWPELQSLEVLAAAQPPEESAPKRARIDSASISSFAPASALDSDWKSAALSSFKQSF